MMSKRGQRVMVLALMVMLLSAGPVLAQTGGTYDLTWGNIGPGGASSGGDYTMEASAGQPDTGAASGGAYTLMGGFWPPAAACSLPGDINQDGSVTVLDIQAVAVEWGTPTPVFPYDQDNDGDVDVQDVMLVAAHLGESC